MADRLIPTTYSGAAAVTDALAACGVGDRIVFEAGAALSYVGQTLSKPATANIQWINQRGANITLTPANNTSFAPGSGWIVGEAAGSGFGFDITLTAGNSPGASGGVVYIASAKSCTFYDSTITGTSLGANAIRVEGGASAAACVLRRCTVKEYAASPNNPAAGEWGVALVVNGGGAVCSVDAKDCTFYGDGASGGVGIYAQVAGRSRATIERCTFRTQSWGIYLTGADATGVNVRYSQFYAHNHYGIEHAAATDPPLVVQRCIFANNTLGDYLPNGAKGGVNVDSCYFEAMEVQVGATWAKNHYDAVIGAPGGTDVNTLIAAADFANFAGNDFEIGGASALINVGNDAGGDGLDAAGVTAVRGTSADVGPYEYQGVDVDVDEPSSSFIDQVTVDVVFVDSFGGTAIVTQVSAENVANWDVVSADPTLAVTGSARQSDTTYRLTLNHAAPGGTWNEFSPLGVVTNYGGVVNGSATLLAPVTDCGIASLAQTGASTVRVTFVASGGGAQIPLQASAETEGNWAVAGDAGPLALVTAARVSDLVYDLTLDRSIEPGETVGVDSSLVATDSGGLCDDPGVDVLVSVWGGLLSATMDDAETLRLTYIDGGPNTAPVEADAVDVAKVVVQGALGGLAATVIVKASTFVYVATLSRPTAPGEACTVDLTAGGVVATIGGGEVAAPGDLPFVGVQWDGGVAKRAEAITPTEIRVEFDDASWYSWPSLASAGRAASWTVQLQGGAVVPVAAAREESRYVYILTTATPMSNRLFEVVTDAVLSAHGGTCA